MTTNDHSISRCRKAPRKPDWLEASPEKMSNIKIRRGEGTNGYKAMEVSSNSFGRVSKRMAPRSLILGTSSMLHKSSSRSPTKESELQRPIIHHQYHHPSSPSQHPRHDDSTRNMLSDKIHSTLSEPSLWTPKSAVLRHNLNQSFSSSMDNNTPFDIQEQVSTDTIDKATVSTSRSSRIDMEDSRKKMMIPVQQTIKYAFSVLDEMKELHDALFDCEIHQGKVPVFDSTLASRAEKITQVVVKAFERARTSYAQVLQVELDNPALASKSDSTKIEQTSSHEPQEQTYEEPRSNPGLTLADINADITLELKKTFEREISSFKPQLKKPISSPSTLRQHRQSRDPSSSSSGKDLFKDFDQKLARIRESLSKMASAEEVVSSSTRETTVDRYEKDRVDSRTDHSSMSVKHQRQIDSWKKELQEHTTPELGKSVSISSSVNGSTSQEQACDPELKSNLAQDNTPDLITQLQARASQREEKLRQLRSVLHTDSIEIHQAHASSPCPTPTLVSDHPFIE